MNYLFSYLDSIIRFITDCNKTCPPGGKLSSNCEFCKCSSISLIGRVMDNLNYPVEGAKIYLESSLYKPVGITDEMGFFNVSGTCIMNETVHVMEDGYAGDHVELKELNATHWWANASLIKYGMYDYLIRLVFL